MSAFFSFIAFITVAAVCYFAAPSTSHSSHLSTVSPSAKHTETAAAFRDIF